MKQTQRIRPSSVLEHLLAVWVVVGTVFVVFAGIGATGWPLERRTSSQRLFRWLLTNRAFGSLLLGVLSVGHFAVSFQKLPFVA